MEKTLEERQKDLVELRNRVMEEFKKAGLEDLQIVGFLEFLKMDTMATMFSEPEKKPAPVPQQPAAPVQPQPQQPAAPQPLQPQKPQGV